jgi:NADH-quinone oxidoreductase subunit G
VEGRAQKTQKILSAPGKAKDDVSVLSAIASVLSPKNFDSKIAEIENYNTVNEIFFSGMDIFNLSYSKIKTKFVISSKVNNFYLADPISKASPTMTKCSKQLLLKSPFLV